MKEEIVLLSNCLRNEGMYVSIRSTLLSYQLLQQLNNSLTFDELHNALKAVYVKDISDNDKFDRVFNKIFKNIEPEDKNLTINWEPEENNPINDSDLFYQEEDVPNQDLGQLQELYDDMIEKRKSNDNYKGKLLTDSFAVLDSYDKRVFELCRKLGKKIANTRSKRRKKMKSHNIDMSRTIRANIKNGGHIVKLLYNKPPLKKNKHVFLCDVSGSCEWVTTWFFALLYGCYQTFDKVQIYDFDNKIIEVTDILKRETFNNIGQINIAHRAKGVMCYGQSDMNKAFKEFLDIADLNHRTDVIILTDCRDWKGKRINGVLESASLLNEISKKVNRVIILNPEKKIRWNNATSCVADYERMGIEVYETSSLEKFEKVIELL